MQAIVIAVVTTVIGAVIAFWAARHYYARSVKHRLAVYWLPAPSIFFGVDSETRKELSIQFRGEAVNELAVTEFLIANEGATPIRDSIEPMKFIINNESRIVDASVTYVHPDGRKVLVESVSDKAFRCDFPLLNPDEYFYVKLITDGRIAKSDVTCQVAAENLPPRIPIENPSNVTIGSDKERDMTLLIPAAIVLILAAAIFLPVVALYQARHGYFPLSGTGFQFVWWLSPSLVITALVSLILLILVVFIFGASFYGEFPPSKKFKGPRRPYHSHVYGYGYGYPFPPNPEQENALTRYPREQP
jgi:hypothetical protein